MTPKERALRLLDALWDAEQQYSRPRHYDPSVPAKVLTARPDSVTPELITQRSWAAEQAARRLQMPVEQVLQAMSDPNQAATLLKRMNLSPEVIATIRKRFPDLKI